MRSAVPLFGAIPESPPHAGVAIARKGFRPFFLLAGIFAALILPLWLSVLSGGFAPSRYLDLVTWHAHEMVFGFSAAVIAGFLLTAVGNWTQRETLVGLPLLGLAGLWIAGRLAITFGNGLVPLADLAFLPLLAVALARPLVATRNKRNFVMLGVLGALWIANLVTHLDALGVVTGYRRTATLTAVDLVVLLVVIIAGRVVPMFTRNATGEEKIASSPKLDALAIGAMALVTVLDASLAAHPLTRVVAGVAALATAARAVPWITRKVFGVPLLWILHLAYAFIPIGLALHAFGHPISTHALTVGAIGGATLGMMARVSLGHSGRPLVVGRTMAISFAALLTGAVARIACAFVPASVYRTMLYTAGLSWSVAFLLFVVVYARVLTSPRVDGKPG